jgi:hypothetical protein
VATATLTSRRSEHHLDLLRTRGRGLWGVVAELGLVAVAVGLNLIVRWYTLDDVDTAVAHARDVLTLQKTLGIDWEWSVQQAALGVAWWSDACAWFYVWGYFPAVFAAMIWLYVRRPTAYALLRNALLASGAIGLFFYAFYPTAPPRLAGLGYADTVASGGLGAEARPLGVANELAAIPSFHIAWLVVAAVVVYRVTSSRALRVVCVAVPASMAYVVVATGNHWVLDIPAGLALALVGLVAAYRLARRTSTG